MAAGTTMPPIAATMGTIAVRGSRSSPSTTSRLISSPTTKKKTAMSASATHAWSVSVWSGPGSDSPVLQKSW